MIQIISIILLLVVVPILVIRLSYLKSDRDWYKSQYDSIKDEWRKLRQDATIEEYVNAWEKKQLELIKKKQ